MARDMKTSVLFIGMAFVDSSKSKNFNTLHMVKKKLYNSTAMKLVKHVPEVNGFREEQSSQRKWIFVDNKYICTRIPMVSLLPCSIFESAYWGSAKAWLIAHVWALNWCA
jgi:hypothetical protein